MADEVNRFESDVVLGNSLTPIVPFTSPLSFESDVVLGNSLTLSQKPLSSALFESDVVLGNSLTSALGMTSRTRLRVMLF